MRATGKELLGAMLVVASLSAFLLPSASPQGVDPPTFSQPVVVDSVPINIPPYFSKAGEPALALAPNGDMYLSAIFDDAVNIVSPIHLVTSEQSRVWKSTDQGVSWNLLNDANGCLTGPNYCQGYADTDITIDPSGNIYVSDFTADALPLLKSTNAGQSWTRIADIAAEDGVDRPWIQSLEAGHLIFAWAKSVGGDLPIVPNPRKVEFRQSFDGGTTLTTVQTLTNNMSQFGPIVASPNGSTYVVPYTFSTGSAETTLRTLRDCAFGPQVVVNCTNVDVLPPDWLHVLVSHNSGGSWTDVNLSHALPHGPGAVGVWKPSLVFIQPAFDSAGNLYMTWSQYNSTFHAKVFWTRSTDGGLTWRTPECLTCSGLLPSNSVFPALAAGSAGRIAIGYYHTDTPLDPNHTPGLWYLKLAYSLNANGALPTWTHMQLSQFPVHEGPICPNGNACLASEGVGDRSLWEYFEMLVTPAGKLAIGYIDDGISHPVDASGGTPREVQIRFTLQTGGPSFRV